MTDGRVATGHHQRRVRCYEFAYVVPWEEIIESMGAGDAE